MSRAIGGPREEGADANELKDWKHMSLTVSMHFKILETQDAAYFAALNLRQDIVNKFETLARSAYQWIFEIVAFRQRKIKELGGGEKTLSAKALTDYFNNHAESKDGFTSAQNGDKINEEFVKAALSVYDKILRNPAAASTILWFEHTYGMKSPLDSVYKLHKMAKRIKSDEVLWVFATMKDKLQSKMMGPRDFSERVLTGSTRDGGGRGLIDLYVLKNDMRVFLLRAEAQRLGINSAALAVMHRLFENFDSYRQKVTPLNSAGVGGSSQTAPSGQHQSRDVFFSCSPRAGPSSNEPMAPHRPCQRKHAKTHVPIGVICSE